MKMAAIVVPGIMGSRLALPASATGGKAEEVWPPTAIETQTGYKRIDKLQDPRLVVTGLIDSVLCFSFYDTLTRLLEQMGFTRVNGNRMLVEFPYDWRRDNFDTAEALAAKLDDLHAQGFRRFMLLGHSMGGLVSRLLLESGKYDQRPWFINIRLFAALATPHLGAPLALARIFGRDTAVGVSGADFAKFARNRDYPSGYQLLPAPGEQAVWNLLSPDLAPLDIYDDATAIALGMDPWLIDKARRMHSVLAKGRRPGQVRYFYVGGTGHRTVTRVNVRYTQGAQVDHNNTHVTETPDAGDGTVPLYSALPAVGQRQIVVNEHATVFAGDPFRRVLYRLFGQDAGAPLEAAPAPVATLAMSVNSPVQKEGRSIELALSVVMPGADPDRPAAAPAIRGELILEEMNVEGRPKRGARRRTRLRYDGPVASRLTVTLDPIDEAGLYRLRWKGEPPAEDMVPFAVGPAE